jgi:hypothetical protein
VIQIKNLYLSYFSNMETGYSIFSKKVIGTIESMREPPRGSRFRWASQSLDPPYERRIWLWIHPLAFILSKTLSIKSISFDNSFFFFTEKTCLEMSRNDWPQPFCFSLKLNGHMAILFLFEIISNSLSDNFL